MYSAAVYMGINEWTSEWANEKANNYPKCIYMVFSKKIWKRETDSHMQTVIKWIAELLTDDTEYLAVHYKIHLHICVYTTYRTEHII